MGISDSRCISSSDDNPRQKPCKYTPNTVYYFKEQLTDKILKERTEIVTEIIVCKTSLINHWYIKVVLDMEHENPLELHYVNNGAIIVQYPKSEQPTSVRETRYTPTFRIKLSDLLKACLNFVKAGSYSYISNNCQDFVIALTNKFTNRSTLSLLLLSQKISRVCPKTKVMALEKEFLLRCQLVGIRLAAQILQETNAHVRDEIDRRASKGQVSGPEIEDFVNRVLTPETGEYRGSDFESFLKEQENETIEVIRESMMQSWRLASFVIFLEESKWGDREDILPPHKALNQYQSYHS